MWRLIIGPSTVAVALPDLNDSMLERAVWGPPVSMRAGRQDLSQVAVLSAPAADRGSTSTTWTGVARRCQSARPRCRTTTVVPALQEAGLRVGVDNSWLRRMLRA